MCCLGSCCYSQNYFLYHDLEIILSRYNLKSILIIDPELRGDNPFLATRELFTRDTHDDDHEGNEKEEEEE